MKIEKVSDPLDRVNPYGTPYIWIRLEVEETDRVLEKGYRQRWSVKEGKNV